MASFNIGSCANQICDIEGYENQRSASSSFDHVVYRRHPTGAEKNLVNIKITNPNLDPMVYALIFPYGEPGWQPLMRTEHYRNPEERGLTRVNVTMMQWRSAQMSIRDDFNPILHSGKLTQQLFVDFYTQLEATRLFYLRQNQSKLRREQYTGLMDFLQTSSNAVGARLGVPIILPSSFEGSPRNMNEKCADAMAIFAQHGHPDLFITFTANPKWPEIVENLQPMDKVEDRADIVTRVFNLKLKQLIDDITTGQLFGPSAAIVHTIEFQKRGLPHAHILLALRPSFKFITAERINKYISAEIPDPERSPLLYAAVCQFMMHGPCGAINPRCPCMKRMACTKQFPKSFADVAVPNDRGYPLYRRRRTTFRANRSFRKEDGRYDNAALDNTCVVPYNPDLLLKYNAHINVECCTSLKAIKYIYKYVYIGMTASTR